MRSAFRSGFVGVLGLPNVGKSSWLNGLVDADVSIVTPFAQTTRGRVMGIWTSDEAQLVFLDTPGWLAPHYLLQSHMLKAAQRAIQDADMLLYIVDIQARLADVEQDALSAAQARGCPVLLLANKADLVAQKKQGAHLAYWQKAVSFAEVAAVSALDKGDIARIRQRIIAALPEGPAYYPADQLSDKSERYLAAEKIRAQVLRHYRAEVPYSTHVWVSDFVHDKDLLRIRAILYVERPSQQGILIGQKGRALRALGIAARQDLSAFFQKKVYLETTVKVLANWRKRHEALKYLGL